jgi:osmoprotectant transport system permease protein
MISRARAPRPSIWVAGLAVCLFAALAARGPRAAAPAPGPAQTETLVVASKNFTESRLLGELMALVLEEHTAFEVEHQSGLGGTSVVQQALLAGEVDIYPDYTGTWWSIVLGHAEKTADPLRAYVVVQDEARERWNVRWLAPFGLQNSYALAMDEARADELGVRAISDLVEHGAELSAAFSIEFMNREDGWPGLARHYGLEFARLRALEHGLAYEAIAAGEIDVIDAYSTDGKLLRYPLRVLADDRGFFPPYNAAPLVRGETLRAYPEIREALAPLAFAIPDSTMIRLNHAVEEGGRSFREVARGFLIERELLEDDGSRPGRRARADLMAFVRSRIRPTLELGWQHLQLSLLAVLLAILFAVPAGIAVAHSRLGERIALGGASVIQTIPSLALLAFMIAIPGLGLSVRSAITALFLYALLPIMRNTVTGLRSVDAELIDAASGIGLTRRQILTRVRLPIATSTIMAGVRTSTVISIGVATLAAFIGAGGLGEPIVTGLYLNDTRLILAGAIPAALLALLADWLLGLVERRLVPRGLRGRDG